MPDITMCSGDECKQRRWCYRYTAKPGYSQSYFTNPPLETDGTCKYYWEDEFTSRDTDPSQDIKHDKKP